MSTPPCPINWPKKRAELSAVQKALSQAQTRIETLAEQVIKAQAERNTAREASARMAGELDATQAQNAALLVTLQAGATGSLVVPAKAAQKGKPATKTARK